MQLPAYMKPLPEVDLSAGANLLAQPTPTSIALCSAFCTLQTSLLLLFLPELNSVLLLQRSLHCLLLPSWLARLLMHNRQLRSQPSPHGKHSLYSCSFIHSFIHSFIFWDLGANHDHWASCLKMSNKILNCSKALMTA